MLSFFRTLDLLYWINYYTFQLFNTDICNGINIAS